MACNTDPVDSDFCPGEWNVSCLKVGSQVKQSWDVEDSKGKAIVITGDTFETEVKDSNGDVVPGAVTNTISGTSTINFLFTTALTATAGIYTYVTTWTRPSTAEIRPIFSGTITVEA